MAEPPGSPNNKTNLYKTMINYKNLEIDTLNQQNRRNSFEHEKKLKEFDDKYNKIMTKNENLRKRE